MGNVFWAHHGRIKYARRQHNCLRYSKTIGKKTSPPSWLQLREFGIQVVPTNLKKFCDHFPEIYPGFCHCAKYCETSPYSHAPTFVYP